MPLKAPAILSYTSAPRSYHVRTTQIPLIKQELSMDLCVAVARSLNTAGVENILWGTHLLSAYTVPTVILELSFVVPGNQLQEAVSALESKSLLLCRNSHCSLNLPRDCQAVSYDNPHAHFHLGAGMHTLNQECGIVKLYTMEDRLWELPVRGRGVSFTDGPTNSVIFANDSSLAVGTPTQGIGRFPNSASEVRIPTLHRFVEAMALLTLQCEPNSHSTASWISELAYVANLVDQNRLSHPAFKELCTWILKRGTSFSIMIRRVREALRSRIHEDVHWNEVQKIRDLRSKEGL
ncbi:hypothetical protein B7463_g5867, partial [Scytalidium lignicola]